MQLQDGKQTRLLTLLFANENAAEAAARRPVRARQLRRQLDAHRARRRLGAAPRHTRQDEFVYILEGEPTLVTEAGRTPLKPGMCAGFKAGTGDAHHLRNETAEDVVYLEIGDRTPGDGATYPDDDIAAAVVDGKWRFTHKDGTPYG